MTIDVAGTTVKRPPALGLFERYLTIWVALCILAGITLGQWIPGPFHALGDMTFAEVNLPVAVLVWLMIVPMLLKIDLKALGQVREHWRGIGVTLFINWAIKPFSMALLGWIFIGWLFRDYLPADQIDSYIAGLILLAAAPCTAMVFVWSHLVEGEPAIAEAEVGRLAFLTETLLIGEAKLGKEGVEIAFGLVERLHGQDAEDRILRALFGGFNLDALEPAGHDTV